MLKYFPTHGRKRHWLIRVPLFFSQGKGDGREQWRRSRLLHQIKQEKKKGGKKKQIFFLVHIFSLCLLDSFPTLRQFSVLTAILAHSRMARLTLNPPLLLHPPAPACHCLLLSKQSECGQSSVGLCFSILKSNHPSHQQIHTSC